MQQLGVSPTGSEFYLGGAPLSSRVDGASQIAIGVTQSGRVFLKDLSKHRKNKASG